MDIVVTYDINTETRKGARRLARVAAICERYGERSQHSVFECRLSDVSLLRLIGELENEIDSATDSVYVYHLAGTLEGSCRRLGRPVTHQPGQSWLL
jgi:CRISPR-associated protein Cas2